MRKAIRSVEPRVVVCGWKPPILMWGRISRKLRSAMSTLPCRWFAYGENNDILRKLNWQPEAITEPEVQKMHSGGQAAVLCLKCSQWSASQTTQRVPALHGASLSDKRGLMVGLCAPARAAGRSLVQTAEGAG